MKLKTLLLSMAALSVMSFTSAFAQTTFRSADNHPDGYPTVEAVKYFGKLLNERSDGRFSLELYHSAQLGDEKDTIEQVRSGVLEFNRISMGNLAGTIKETNVPAMPYVFRSIEHMHKVMDGAIGDQIKAAFEPVGLVALAFYDSGARSFYNSKRPIRTPDDMKGLKFRVIPSDVFVDMTAALGGNATPMPYGEVYSGIETGVIDGAENNFPSFETAKHYEVAKYLSLNEHVILPEVFVMNKTAFEALSAEDQEMVRQAAKDSVTEQRRLWDLKTKESRELVEKAGVQINDVDKQAFIDAMAPVYEKHVKDPVLKQMIEDIRAVE